MTRAIDVQPGFGIIESAQGGPIGSRDDISYTCTYVFPHGTYEHVPNQVPVVDRFPPPLNIRAHNRGVCFPAYIVNQRIQPYMARELPDFGPCQHTAGVTPSGPAGGQSLAWAWALATDAEKRAFAQQLAPFLKEAM